MDNSIHASPAYHSFQVTPPEMTTNATAGPSETVRSQQQRRRPDTEPSSSPGQTYHYTPFPLTNPNTTSTPSPEPTHHQQPPLPHSSSRPSSSFMNNLYSFDDDPPERFDDNSPERFDEDQNNGSDT